MDPAHGDYPGRRRATLTAKAKSRAHSRRHRLVEVGVGVDDDGVLPAELSHDPADLLLSLARVRRGFDDAEANVLRSGEGDHTHVGWLTR